MNLKSTSKSGFTLVELLVTILIIVILSVTMLPLLKPFVTQAQYSAEGVPVIGNIRTKVELFRIENDYLPGVPRNANGSIVKNSSVDANTGNTVEGYATSHIADSAVINANQDGTQWMKIATTTDDTTGDTSEDEEYYTVYSGGTKLIAATGEGDHVWKRLSINYSDLTGKKLRPEDMQYLVIKSDGDSFYWVVACFGHGDGGLASGCGYAVAEFNDPVNKHKFVATFENYKPVNTTQLHFKVDISAPSRDSNPNEGLRVGEVFLPTAAALETSYSSCIENMRTFGWQVQ